MNLWKQLVARRRRKAHERYLREQELQKALENQDVEEAMRRTAQSSATGQQGQYWQGP
jgi:hypothetical protein